MKIKSVEIIEYPLKEAFTIARGSKTVARALRVTVSQDGIVGIGEGVPYPRYHETPEAALLEIQNAPEDPKWIPKSCAAQNALGAARLDWRAKSARKPVWEILGITPPVPTPILMTLGLDRPEIMAQKAKSIPSHIVLKLKLGNDGAADEARLRAIVTACPDTRLVVDANEGWSTQDYERLLPVMQACHVEMIEQPFAQDQDSVLATLPRPIPICADESAHDAKDIPRLAALYDVVNIKLDKTGGLEPALVMKKKAQESGLAIMVGCMVGSSLSMAPAILLAPGALFVDLDGPLFLAQDTQNAIHYQDGIMYPFNSQLWG